MEDGLLELLSAAVCENLGEDIHPVLIRDENLFLPYSNESD